MLKFGFRKNNFYPLMLLLFIFLRICLDKILSIHPYKNNIDFIISFIIFFSQILIGAVFFIYYYCTKKKVVLRPRNYVLAFYGKNKHKIFNDNKWKKICLIIISSFFNFVGCVIRNADVINFGKKEENNSLLEVRIRSIQIIISSLLCYFTLRLNIYKHQKLSLIIISVLLVFIIILELIIASSLINKILSMIICIISCLTRAFLDVTEKYLFDYNYINCLSMLIYEGLLSVFFFMIYFIVNKNYQNQGKNILNDMSQSNWSLISFILLILVYIVISGFRNAYRVTTNKYYSPMSRALFESSLDPFLFIYNFFILKADIRKSLIWVYFSFVLFSLLVIAFFALVYNDFIVLNCCGLAYNTYSGINSRLNADNIERNDTVNSFFDGKDSCSNYSEELSRAGSYEMEFLNWKMG